MDVELSSLSLPVGAVQNATRMNHLCSAGTTICTWHFPPKVAAGGMVKRCDITF